MSDFPEPKSRSIHQERPKRWITPARLLLTLQRFPQIAIGSSIMILFIVVGTAAPAIAPYEYNQQNLLMRLQDPIWSGGSSEHIFGTDQFGRDVLTRIIYGAQVSLLVGVFAVVIAGVFGTIVGLVSGYAGGNLDAFLMRVVDIQLAFPYLLVAIVIVAFWGAGLLPVIIALSLSSWMGFARTVRSFILGLKESDYVMASRAVGATAFRVVARHLLPNIFGPLLVFTTFQLPARILGEATLSFLGLGIQPPMPSWGNMLAENRGFITSHPWLVILPGLSISVVALGANLLGDGLRDFLDPRTRRRV
jgi:peptide/nickel transport system permease protein